MARKNRFANLLFMLFVLIGASGVVAGGAIALRSAAFVARAQRAEGTVVRYVRTKGRRGSAHPVVRFQVNDQPIEFEGRIGTTPPAYPVGAPVTVYFLPENPRDAMIDSFVDRYILAVIFVGFGTIFLAIGGGFWLVPALIVRKRNRIIADGVPAQAKVIEIHVDHSLKINGASPWVIMAEFKDELTDQTITCKSHYLWDDPRYRFPVGSQVTVYHLQDRPDKYAFQLEERPA